MQLVNYFVEEVSKRIGLLVSEHVFALPKLEIDAAISFAKVIYMGKNLAIEFVLDEREEDLDCKIARIADGKRVPDYAVDEKGIRVRDSLAALLRRRGVRAALFHKVARLPFRDRIPITLSDFANMLEKYGKDILADSPDVFDSQ